jgi:hypothetical protein
MPYVEHHIHIGPNNANDESGGSGSSPSITLRPRGRSSCSRRDADVHSREETAEPATSEASEESAGPAPQHDRNLAQHTYSRNRPPQRRKTSITISS